MIGNTDKPQDELFYAFNLEDVVPQDHLLRYSCRPNGGSRLPNTTATDYAWPGRTALIGAVLIRNDARAGIRKQRGPSAVAVCSQRTSVRFRLCTDYWIELSAFPALGLVPGSGLERW